ncbi:hypothetical protein L208DRAFT_1379063 [Tricholoma matsutake]|nr:hypothetical protein L208DRAFT_1379063 [Tricholoma matsutake 945]
MILKVVLLGACPGTSLDIVPTLRPQQPITDYRCRFPCPTWPLLKLTQPSTPELVKKGCTTSNSTTKRLTESKRRSSEHHGCTKERGIHAYLRGRKKERVMVVALGLSFTKLRPSEVKRAIVRFRVIVISTFEMSTIPGFYGPPAYAGVSCRGRRFGGYRPDNRNFQQNLLSLSTIRFRAQFCTIPWMKVVVGDDSGKFHNIGCFPSSSTFMLPSMRDSSSLR